MIRAQAVEDRFDVVVAVGEGLEHQGDVTVAVESGEEGTEKDVDALAGKAS